jgi:hypothetical protein
MKPESQQVESEESEKFVPPDSIQENVTDIVNARPMLQPPKIEDIRHSRRAPNAHIEVLGGGSGAISKAMVDNSEMLRNSGRDRVIFGLLGAECPRRDVQTFTYRCAEKQT